MLPKTYKTKEKRSRERKVQNKLGKQKYFQNRKTINKFIIWAFSKAIFIIF